MTLLIISNTIICGICLALGLVHLSIFFGRRERRADLFFAIMAVCTAAAALTESWVNHAETVAAFVQAHKVQTVFLGTTWIFLAWFTAAYTGFQRRWLTIAITVAYGVSAVMNVVFPYGVLYAKIEALHTILLPWGEQISVASGPASPWRFVPDITWFLLLFFAAECCVRMGRGGERHRAIVFGTSLFLFLGFSYLHGTLMDFGIVGPPSIHHVCFLGLILVMSGSIRSDVVKASVLSRELVVSEQRWRSLLDNMALLVVGFDTDGLVTFANPTFARISGFSEAEILGRPLLELVPERDRQDLRDRLASAMKGELRPSVVRPILTKDGEDERQVKWSNVIVRDEGNQITGFLSIGEDVTELGHAQQALLDEKERMDTMLSTLNTGLALINRDLTVAWVNATTQSILPWEELVGKLCYEAAAKRDEPCEGCGALMAFSDGQLHETERQSPVDGRWHHIVSLPIKDKKGTVVNVLESVTDITNRKEAELARDRALEEVQALKNQLEAENIYLKTEIQEASFSSEIVGRSNALRYVLSRAKEVAETDATVLVQGETGTGKELISRAIHEDSQREKKPFIKVNCAALPRDLIESELFGHERGAFTGAHRLHSGRFELAHGGTLLLDEISELPLVLQPKLLRVLQDGEFERVGGTDTLEVDVRVIAATNQNLDQEVDRGRFRADLFYRLNVYPITLPPLRKRRDDIPLLVEHFVPQLASRIGKHIDQIPPWVMEQLVAYNWPGNVRELKNVLERAVITSSGSVLRLPEALGQKAGGSTKVTGENGELVTLSSVERSHILKVLKATEWRLSGDKGAAKILDLNPSTLRFRMKKLGIEKE